MKTQEKHNVSDETVDATFNEMTTQKNLSAIGKLRIREGALTPGGKKRVSYAEDGAFTTVDAESYKEVSELIDDPLAIENSDINDAISMQQNTTEALDQVEPTAELSRFARIKNKLGGVASRAFWRGYTAAGNVVEKASSVKVSLQEKRAAGEHLTKKEKLMLGSAALALTGLAVATAYGAVRHGEGVAHAFETMNDASNGSTGTEYIPAVNTRVLIGGRGDTSGDGIASIMNGLKEHGATNTVKIDYPAEIAPIDATSLDASTEIAANKAYNAYQAANGNPVELIGYSEGTQGVQDAANRIAAENGGKLPDNVKVLLIATPNADNTGIFSTDYVKALDPAFKTFGASTDREIPAGATVIAMDTDFWSNSGDKPLTTMISQAIGLAGDGHRPPADGMNYTENIVNGVTYRTYTHEGTQTAALRVAEQHGLLVTREADAFGQAIAPQGEVGVEGTRINAGEVLQTGGDLAEDSLNRAGINPEHSKIVGDIVQGVPQEITQPLFDAAQDIPEQLVSTIANGQSGGGFQEIASPVTGNWSTPLQAPAQVQQFAQQAVPQVQQMVEQFVPAAQQPAVNNFLGQFGIK